MGNDWFHRDIIGTQKWNSCISNTFSNSNLPTHNFPFQRCIHTTLMQLKTFAAETKKSFWIIDLKVPAKIAVWFLETGRFLPVSIRVPWFLFWFWMGKRSWTLKSKLMWLFLFSQVATACQTTVQQCGLLSKLCDTLMASGIPADILTETINALSETIRGHAENQTIFTHVTAPSSPPRSALILLLMAMVNEKQPFALRYCNQFTHFLLKS